MKRHSPLPDALNVPVASGSSSGEKTWDTMSFRPGRVWMRSFWHDVMVAKQGKATRRMKS